MFLLNLLELLHSGSHSWEPDHSSNVISGITEAEYVHPVPASVDYCVLWLQVDLSLAVTEFFSGLLVL